MPWVKEALLRGELKITDDKNCPFCNPEHKTDIGTKINACEEHKWVNKVWYESRFKEAQVK
jgi:ribosomal protein L37AE/L43A